MTGPAGITIMTVLSPGKQKAYKRLMFSSERLKLAFTPVDELGLVLHPSLFLHWLQKQASLVPLLANLTSPFKSRETPVFLSYSNSPRSYISPLLFELTVIMRFSFTAFTVLALAIVADAAAIPRPLMEVRDITAREAQPTQHKGGPVPVYKRVHPRDFGRRSNSSLGNEARDEDVEARTLVKTPDFKRIHSRDFGSARRR